MNVSQAIIKVIFWQELAEDWHFWPTSGILQAETHENTTDYRRFELIRSGAAR